MARTVRSSRRSSRGISHDFHHGLLFIAAARTAAILYLAARPPLLEDRFGMQSLAEMDGYTRVGRQVGSRLAESLPPDTRIATTLAGTIPYFSRLFTVDEWGLNDRQLAQQPADRVRFRGHLKRPSTEYLHIRGVDLVIGHPVVCSCANPCRQDGPTVFLRLSGDRCLRLSVLSARPALCQHLCAYPDTFLLDSVTCSGAGTDLGTD